jgi:hypothetical protein
MRGISWLAAKTGQLFKKDSAPWSKYIYSTVRSESRCAIVQGVSSDVHECLYRPESV